MPLAQQLRERTLALTGSIGSHRLALYSLFSLFGVVAAVANALRNHSNFYSVAIYLSKSSRSVLILANFSFLVALLAAHVVQKIFFGALRPSEIERLYDRLWFFITESLLAFTIFRDEFDATFVAMFGFLLFVKSFHWIAGDRIEWMDQRPYPGPSLLFHVRMTGLFLILWVTDLLVFMIAVDSTLAHGISGMVLFASEYGILMATVVNTAAKYLLCTYELRRAGQRGGENAPPWENKSMWVFYIELATDFLKLTTYLVFFIIIMTFYGIPLNILRDVYVTGRSLVTRLRSLHRYQTATRNMDERYPNATEAEMAAMSDHTCIICREEMILPPPPQNNDAPPPPSEGPNTTPKKLPCGHIFHFYCLRSWLERQQSCPTCRRNVLEDTPPRAAAAAPQPPVPGAAPQPPNGAGNPNAFGNNPLGLVGRLFAPPGQPQPRQPGPVHQNNLALNGQNAPGQPIVIEYHFQYPVARQQGPMPPAAPQFQGFPGPGGAWQPWPQGDGVLPAELPQAVPNEAGAPAVDEPISEPPATSNTAPDNDLPASETGSSTPSNAREAAALAALRRLNSQRPSPTATNPSQTDTTTTSAPTSAPTTSSHTAAPTQPAETSDSPSTSGTPGRRVDVPHLIPMYDYSVPGLHANPTLNRPVIPGTHVPSPSIPSSTQSGYFRRPVARGPAPDPRYQQRPPLSQLPPTLTEEQLALMDSVTREAIDERLRVLEGVSSAVYRCIDDLMRMRSALPISTAAAGPVPGPSHREVPPTTGAPTPSTPADTAAPVLNVVNPEGPGGEAPPEG
ncbi:RING-type domain-containing protein [Favolaschia claudopus]|uniref:RING-type E3 ubiquitin transferase n=1 Tax=Favolaschia claudopus TaxID=2862362 RepID=A0AAW0E0G3_9AGAR